MSKVSNMPSSGYKIVSSDSVGNLQGQVLTLLEALGLKETQEQSIKSILSNTLWQWYHDSSWHAEIPQEEATKYFRKQGK